MDSFIKATVYSSALLVQPLSSEHHGGWKYFTPWGSNNTVHRSTSPVSPSVTVILKQNNITLAISPLHPSIIYERLSQKVKGAAADASFLQLNSFIDLVKHSFKNLGSATGVSWKFHSFDLKNNIHPEMYIPNPDHFRNPFIHSWAQVKSVHNIY